MQLKIIAAALALSGTAALADVAMPDIDVEAQCRQQAEETQGGNSQFVYCMRQEQDRYDRLKTMWASTPDEVRTICLGQWHHYSMIYHCINDEMRSAVTAKTLRFKK